MRPVCSTLSRRVRGVLSPYRRPLHNPRIAAISKFRPAETGDSPAQVLRKRPPPPLLAPVSGASQGLVPLTGAIRPYPCAKQPSLNPSARRKLYASALNSASASFLISPMHLTRQYP